LKSSGSKLTVLYLSAVHHWGVGGVATLGKRVVLGVSTPRDTLLFQKVDNVVGFGTSEVVWSVRVPAIGSGSEVVNVVWLRKSNRELITSKFVTFIRQTAITGANDDHPAHKR
jgi:hypothetical protein